MRSTAYVLFITCLLLAPASAQSGGSDTTSSGDNQSQPKAHKVWDNESIQELQGGINIVGPSNNNRPAHTVHSTPQQQMPKPSGVVFRAHTLEGQEVSSDDLYGRPILVQFWATWCPHCQADQAPVDRIARQYANSGLVVLAVDEDKKENEQVVRQYLSVRPRAVPIILKEDSNLDKVLAPQGYPTYYMIDGQGRIVGSRKGEIGEHGLRSLVAKAGLM